MATYDQLMDAARKADAANDPVAAKRFLELANQSRTQQQPVAAQENLIEQIPRDQTPVGVENRPQIENPTWVDAFLQGAAALPITSGLARGMAYGLRGRTGGQAAESFARAVTPRTGKQLVAEGLVGGAAGVASQQVGQQLPEGPIRDIASMAVGAAVSAPLAMSRNVQTFLTDGLSDITKVGSNAASSLGSVRANQLAKTAVEANPNLVPSIVRASEIEQTLGASLPTLAAANGDTTISSLIQSQIAKGSPLFTADMKRQYEVAEEALKRAKKGIAPSMEEVDEYVKRKATSEQLRAQEIDKAQEAALVDINNRISRIGTEAFYDVRTSEQLGAETRNLINAQRKIAQNKLSPEYERVLGEAEAAGVQLSAEQATGLKDFVKDKKADEVFQSFPKLYGMIQQKFAPKAVPFSQKMAEKYTFAKEAEVTKPVSVKELDSLKREVNAQLRKADPQSSDYRYLSELRAKLDEAIDTMPADFKNAYRAIDERYYQEIGIPYRNAEGVLKIDRAKFEQQVTPSLTKNPESLREAITAMGRTPDAYRIAEDAFMLDLSKNRSVLKNDGTINTDILRRYMRDNKASIDQIPGFRQKLEGLAANADGLIKDRERILSIQETAKEQVAESLWSRAYGTTGGLAGLVKNALNNPKELDRLLEVTATNLDANDAIKAAMVKDLTTMQGNRIEVFNQHRATLERVFGQVDTKKLMDLVEASQLIRDNPLRFQIAINQADKTSFEKATGSKLEQVASEYRNPILGQFRVMANQVSRFFSNQAKQSESVEVQRFLRNINELPAFAEAVREFNAKGPTEKVLKLMQKALGNYSVVMAGGAAAGFAGGRTIEDPEAAGYAPTDPTLLEGFAGNPRR